MILSRIASTILLISTVFVSSAGSAFPDQRLPTPELTSWTTENVRPDFISASRSSVRGSLPIQASGTWELDLKAVTVIPSVQTIFKNNLTEFEPMLDKAKRVELSTLKKERAEAQRQKKAAAAAAKQKAEEEKVAVQAAKESEAQKTTSVIQKAVPAGESQNIAHKMVLSRGWDEGQFSCLVKLWNKESNWNHLAENPSSGAYGIPQSLPGSKMASAGADWRSNPSTQIKWGLDYIQNRYGNPCSAWAHSGQVGWY